MKKSSFFCDLFEFISFLELKFKQFRDRLRLAMQSRNRAALDKALMEWKAVGIPEDKLYQRGQKLSVYLEISESRSHYANSLLKSRSNILVLDVNFIFFKKIFQSLLYVEEDYGQVDQTLLITKSGLF